MALKIRLRKGDSPLFSEKRGLSPFLPFSTFDNNRKQ
jgi:hypothetical protein